ncbi:peptidylprolyl isomerase [Sporocytophaga myxococcoides]|uniref:peptidylprolyl isomerase n=1 Tax=Sporocytophaga myxococcoides TaxID=153721 RepID=UPI000491C48E|nr:peptidylprolyl isomerase [Sporocytophaga myxococcoides]
MKKSFVAFLSAALIVSGCKTSEKTSKTATDPSVAVIGGQPVNENEFVYVYNKNNSSSPDAYTEKSIKEYLDLYINFKLKVKEAESLGIDTTTSFKKELEGYRKQLAQPYLTEKGVTEQLIKEAYERMKEEVRASHILINVNPDADPKDTLAAFNKINEIRQKALGGESFEKLAKQYSQDPSAKTNGGDLGYFTALQMVYPFEDAAYKTPVGQISQPVKTRFGYHIIQVKDKRKSQGQVRVAHIMVRATTGTAEADSLAAKQKIDEIYAKVQKGEDWNQLTNQFSDDVNSKSKGGELPWFSTGRMIPSFEDAAFKLAEVNQVSKPVQTPYGWHVIKLLEKKGLEPFEELEPTLKAKVSKDSRSELNKTRLIERLKRENNFTENAKSLEVAISKTDSTLLDGKWNFTPDTKNNPVLFNVGKQNYTVNDFLTFVKEKQRPRKNTSTAQYVKVLYKEYADQQLLGYEESHLADKYVDYKMLVKEYRDGILLFQLMDEKVWSKAIEDTTGLKGYFNQNRDKFKWDRRADAVIFNVKDKATLDKLKAELAKGKFEVKDQKLSAINYKANTSDIEESYKKDLDKVVSQLQKDKHLVLELSASAEAKEPATLSLMRGASVYNYIKSKGVDSTRIIIKDLGKGTPKKTEAEKNADRKVGLVVYSTSKKSLENTFNQNAPLTLQVTEGKFQKGDNEVLNSIEWKEGTSQIEKDGRIYFIKINKVEEPRAKTFEESRGLAISDYQTYLEQEWIKDMKKKYPVSINEPEIQKLVKTKN